MPHALLPGTELTHGVVWVTARGRIDSSLAVTLGRAAGDAAIRHDNLRVLFDLRAGHLQGGAPNARRLATSFARQIARRTGASVALLTAANRPEFLLLEGAFRLRGIQVARFCHREDALAWLDHARSAQKPQSGPPAGDTRDVIRSFVESRLGIPRSKLENELADLYLCLLQLAGNRGVKALRGAARVESDAPPRQRPQLRIVRDTRRPVRRA